MILAAQIIELEEDGEMNMKRVWEKKLNAARHASGQK